MSYDLSAVDLDDLLNRTLVGNQVYMYSSLRRMLAHSLASGRAERFMQRNGLTALEDYVRHVAVTVEAEVRELAALVDAGENVWDRLTRRLQRRAYDGLRRLGHADHTAYERAADFAQETIAALLGNPYPGDVPYTAWSNRVLHNCLLQHVYRSRDVLGNHKVQFMDLEPEDDQEAERELADPAAGAFADAAERQHALRWVLDRLTQPQREVLEYGLAGWTPEEIAERTGRTAQAVYNLRHRAIREANRLLNED